MDNLKNHTIKDLLQAFQDAGYPKSYMWIIRQERKGNLILPRSTTNYKKLAGNKPIGFVREMSWDQIHAIISAFIPGGKGSWDWRKNET